MIESRARLSWRKPLGVENDLMTHQKKINLLEILNRLNYEKGRFSLIPQRIIICLSEELNKKNHEDSM